MKIFLLGLTTQLIRIVKVTGTTTENPPLPVLSSFVQHCTANAPFFTFRSQHWDRISGVLDIVIGERCIDYSRMAILRDNRNEIIDTFLIHEYNRHKLGLDNTSVESLSFLAFKSSFIAINNVLLASIPTKAIDFLCCKHAEIQNAGLEDTLNVEQLGKCHKLTTVNLDGNSLKKLPCFGNCRICDVSLKYNSIEINSSDEINLGSSVESINLVGNTHPSISEYLKELKNAVEYVTIETDSKPEQANPCTENIASPIPDLMSSAIKNTETFISEYKSVVQDSLENLLGSNSTRSDMDEIKQRMAHGQCNTRVLSYYACRHYYNNVYLQRWASLDKAPGQNKQVVDDIRAYDFTSILPSIVSYATVKNLRYISEGCGNVSCRR